MARARNPRRVVLTILRNVAANTRTMIRRWDQEQTRYTAEGTRPRRDDEKVENDVTEWEHLVKYMDAVIYEAEAVRDHARAQIARLGGAA